MGVSALILLGWNTKVEIAHTGNADQYYDISINGGDISITAKSGVQYPNFEVFRV